MEIVHNHQKFVHLSPQLSSVVLMTGNWGCGGTFDALAKLSASIPDAYQQASEFGDLHVGDLHLIRINGRLLCSLFLILDCLITKYASDCLKTHKHTSEVVQVLMTGHRIQCSTHETMFKTHWLCV